MNVKKEVYVIKFIKLLFNPIKYLRDYVVAEVYHPFWKFGELNGIVNPN